MTAFPFELAAYLLIVFAVIVAVKDRIDWFPPRPHGLPWVLHKCDVKSCVNPHHLFIGKPEENVQDAINKGRNGSYKLDRVKVMEIRWLFKKGIPKKVLACWYSVGEHIIYGVISGMRYNYQSVGYESVS